MNSAATVVPWFLKNMPAAYFRQTAPDLRKQHLKAIQAFRDLKQSDLSLRIETKYEGGIYTQITCAVLLSMLLYVFVTLRFDESNLYNRKLGRDLVGVSRIEGATS